MTPGAQQHLRQHLAPPALPPGITEGLFAVEPNEAGGLGYERVVDVRRRMIVEDSGR
jgi:hypothetical protein